MFTKSGHSDVPEDGLNDGRGTFLIRIVMERVCTFRRRLVIYAALSNPPFNGSIMIVQSCGPRFTVERRFT